MGEMCLQAHPPVHGGRAESQEGRILWSPWARGKGQGSRLLLCPRPSCFLLSPLSSLGPHSLGHLKHSWARECFRQMSEEKLLLLSSFPPRVLTSGTRQKHTLLSNQTPFPGGVISLWE